MLSGDHAKGEYARVDSLDAEITVIIVKDVRRRSEAKVMGEKETYFC